MVALAGIGAIVALCFFAIAYSMSVSNVPSDREDMQFALNIAVVVAAISTAFALDGASDYIKYILTIINNR